MIRILQETYYNGKSYKDNDECKLDETTEQRWIKNGIAEEIQSRLFDANFNDMTDEELTIYAEEHNVDISKAKSRASAIKMLMK